MLLECKFATYGDQCKETCGQCQDLTKCHYKNGTCLTGCKAGYNGVLCKTRKYMLVNCVIYWPIVYILEHMYLKIIPSIDLVQCRYVFPLHICGMVWYGMFLLRVLGLYYDMSDVISIGVVCYNCKRLYYVVCFPKKGLLCYEICGDVPYF